jgi:ribosomal-protein-alanine N-acetyltransferase
MSTITSPSAIETRVHIRWMIRRDMPEVLAIEHNNQNYPWSEEKFLKCLRQRNVIGMVAEHGEKILGFMIYRLHKDRLTVCNFAIEPTHSRQGIGTQMINKLKGKLFLQRRNMVRFYVRETNLAAQLFLRSQGYVALETFREYFDDTREDAYKMEFKIINEP